MLWRWEQIRHAIVSCPDLPDAAKDEMLSTGNGTRGTLTSPKNAAKTGKPIESGAHVVQSEELSQRYRQFSKLLHEWGFSPAQLALINDALRDSGLEFVAGRK